MNKLTWIEATSGNIDHKVLWGFLEEQIKRLARGRVAINFVHLPFATGGVRTPANRLLNDAAVLACAVDHAKESDAVVVGCWAAPTENIRAALNHPDSPSVVTALPDASVRLVGSIARRAVVLTVSPQLVSIFEGDLARLGALGFHSDRPVRAYSPETTHDDVVRAIAEPDFLIEKFDQEAKLAVEDGADAIVVGCGYLAPIFSQAGYTHVKGHPDVSVIDCGRLAMEHAITLLELQSHGISATSRGYPAPKKAQEKQLGEAVAHLISW